VEIDDAQVEAETTINATHIMVHLGYTRRAHTVEVVGTTVLSEFPTGALLLLLVLVTLAVTIVKKRVRNC